MNVYIWRWTPTDMGMTQYTKMWPQTENKNVYSLFDRDTNIKPSTWIPIKWKKKNNEFQYYEQTPQQNEFHFNALFVCVLNKTLRPRFPPTIFWIVKFLWNRTKFYGNFIVTNWSQVLPKTFVEPVKTLSMSQKHLLYSANLVHKLTENE